ncbi:MAG: hypothetical protein JXR68_03810 [Bacteroidales bacterium]|nr:hypothetical protein [Bacteroidales bacterium]
MINSLTLFFLLLFLTIINAQNLTSIDPTTSMPLQPLSVTISGVNTNFTQATYTTV